ncbi:MAG: IPT/TIG domain-containing protein [Bacteroidetes bacterium]|nr:IPT/TIG domain-containing protein [Bacteroidota bacterium]
MLLVLTIQACKKNGTGPVLPDSPNITISSISPTHGPYNTTVTITGQDFDQLKAPDSVLLNGKKVTIVSFTSTQIVANIPSLAGSGSLSVWYNGKAYQTPAFSYDSVHLVTTIAGSATESGEVNAKGLDARFNGPVGIVADGAHNLYVVEELGKTVRKIDTAGNVTTLAGPANYEAGNVDATGAAARFSNPEGICLGVDGFLYVADRFTIRKVSTTGAVSTFTGVIYNGSPTGWYTDGDPSIATFATPYGIACDKNGNFYVADAQNNKIRKISPAGVVGSLAGVDYYHYGQKDGQGAGALFFEPTCVAADPSGIVYAVDGESHLLRKITPDGTVTTLLGPTEPSITGSTELFAASALATDKSGNQYFAIRGGIIKRTADGKIIRYAIGGIGEIDGPLPVAAFRSITGIYVDDSETIYITDNNRIRKISWQ